MKCHDVELKHELFDKSKTYSHNRIENGIRQVFNSEERGALVEEQLKQLQVAEHLANVSLTIV